MRLEVVQLLAVDAFTGGCGKDRGGGKRGIMVSKIEELCVWDRPGPY